MNKELVKKYKKEFDHWLNGGNVQAFYIKDDEPKWITDEECIEYEGHDNFSHIMQNSLEPEDVLIVIDDAYSDYRKAFAEGKIVQEQDYFNKQWRDMKTDNFLKYSVIDGYYEGVYRIKPDVPKFKVGDWVIHNGVVKQVTMTVNGLINSLDKQLAVIKKEESLELWKPKSNEYFWYKNDLVKFDKTETNAGVLLQSIRGCAYYPSENFEDFCEPFIGKLPSKIEQY